jgi:hypothetical protein
MAVNVTDFGPDGVTPDTTEALQLTNNNTLVASAAVNPTNNRQVLITGVGAGPGSIKVTAPGVPIGSELTVTFTVVEAPNLSYVQYDSSAIAAP